MVKYREILRLRALGISIRGIAHSCGCSPTTVETVLHRATAKGVEWPLPAELDDRALHDVLYPKGDRKPSEKAPIDHVLVDREMSRPGVTLTLLWSEYCDGALSRGEEPYMYSAFCQAHRRWAARNSAVMRIERRPGQEMQVDWAGDAMRVVDPDTGEALEAWVFVACLPFSGRIYAEAFWDMRAPSWIRAHADAFAFFGGVAPVLVPDNCKTGVLKNTIDELVLNEQYRRMAEHYGCAVVPARPRRPRDKGAVESSVRVVEQRAMAPLRDRTFTSLAELNAALREGIDAINAAPFQKREGSRDEVFLGQEERALAPLPDEPFEVVDRRRATVNFSYHVPYDGRWYSVPFRYVKREVDVCATATAVWVECGGERVAMHARLRGPRGSYSTDPGHMPDSHRDYAAWSGDAFREAAAQVGPSCAAVVASLLDAADTEQQAYRPCRSLLRLADRHGDAALEQACAKALSLTAAPSLKTVRTLAAGIAAGGPADPDAGAYLRGGDYYSDFEERA